MPHQNLFDKQEAEARFARGSRTKYRRAMTLVEVMLGMFVLVVVFGAALMAVVQVTRMVATAKNRVRAVAILNQKMEEMRAQTFITLKANLAQSSFVEGEIPMSTASSTISDNDLTDGRKRCFKWTRTNDTSVATEDDHSASLLKIVVRVEWDDLKVTSSVNAYSYFSEHGVMAKSATSS